MEKFLRTVLMGAAGIILPKILQAESIVGEMKGLHGVLGNLYEEMIPLCSKLIGVGQGVAGYAATWYIASRVWRHIANAEPIDFYPLFRPFVIGLAIAFYPSVVDLINGVMKPVVAVTAAMSADSDKAISVMLKQKEEALKKTSAWQMYVGESGAGDRDRWYKYTNPDNISGDTEGMVEGIGNDIKFAMSKASYNFRNSIKEWMSEVLSLLYEAAGLCINTIRTFNLIVLAILGPLVLGIAVFDGFQHTLTVWLARYINVFLWLPVANIFGSIIGKIQEKMLTLDINQVQNTGDTFFSSTDVAYLIFLIIGIAGYFTVPSVANYIVNAGGGGGFIHKVDSLFNSTSRSALNTMSSASGMAADAMGNAAGTMSRSMNSSGINSGYFQDSRPNTSSYQEDKLSGK